jgi:hypothetical protein
MARKKIVTIHESVTAERVMQAIAEDCMLGICTACGEDFGDSLEPDAREVTCDSCGKPSVYGAEELLIQQLVH